MSIQSSPFVQRLIHSYIRSNFVIPVRFRGLNIRIRPFSYDPVVMYSLLIRRIYGNVPRGCSVVDVGAHVGIFSLYSVLSGSKEVLAFEPESRNFQLLYQNLHSNRLHERIHSFNMAVWSSEGERTLFTSRGSAFHGFFPDKLHAGGFEKVRCIGINTVLKQVDPPVLLKIDAEGSEYEIIEHMTNENLEKLQRIALEYHVSNPDLRDRLPHLLRFLRTRGFTVSLRPDHPILIATKGV